MTGRERLNAILHRRAADRLSWTSLVDGPTLDALPEGWRGVSGIEFYRRIGCDIFLLNGWGTKIGFSSPRLQWPSDVRQEWREDGDRRVQEIRLPSGTLNCVYRHGHPVKYLVGNLGELRLYRSMWEGASFVEQDDGPALKALDDLIGEDGIVTRFWGPSTVPRLLENDMGIENFYYLLSDHPGEMEELIALMHEKELKAFEILARGPCESVTLVENTSTRYIGPEIYRKYNGPHVKDFVDAVHAVGKIAIIHMCGHVKGLLDQIKGTGLDGVHALTPPPVGNTPWELALDALGEDCIILSAMPANIFVSEPIRDIGRALDAFYTPRLRRSHFVMGAGADGIRVPLERFQAVAAWFEKNARI